MIDMEKLAGALYAAYCMAVGGRAYNGDPLPNWDAFRSDPEKKKQSDAWVVTAEAAVAVLNAGS
jgi:hypothetical protein